MSAQDDYNAYQSSQRTAQRRATARAKGRKPKRGTIPAKHKKTAKPKSSYLDDPNAVNQPRTLRDIYRDADAATNLRYGDQQRSLDQRIQNTDPAFERYKAQVMGLQQGVQQGYQQAVADINARTAATQTANDQSRQQLLAQMQKDAASRGATVDPNLFKDDANAATVRRQGADAFANLLQGQSQAQGGYFGGVQASAGMAQLQQHQLNADAQRALQADKGDFRTNYISTAADKEHTKLLENQAYGVKTYTAQQNAKAAQDRIKSTAKTQRAQRKATSRNERNTVITSGAFAGLTHGQVRALSPAEKKKYTDAYAKNGGGKNGAGLTPAQKNAAADKRHKATSRIVDAESRWNLYKTVPYTPKGSNKARKPHPSEIKQRLIKEGFSTEEIHLALMWSQNKPWSAHDRAIAKRLGIRLPKRKPPKLPPKKKGNSPIDPRGLLNPKTYD